MEIEDDLPPELLDDNDDDIVPWEANPKEKIPKGYKSRNACITLFTDKQAEVMWILARWSRVTFVACGLEYCPKTGKPHLQIYIEFTDSMLASTFFKRVASVGNGSYFSARYGSQGGAVRYCQKDFNCKYLGVPKVQGRRQDLRDIFECIKEGASLYELSTKFFETYSRYYKWVEHMRKLHGRPQTFAKHSIESCEDFVKCHRINFEQEGFEHSVQLVGPPGCGKSQFALAHFKSPHYITTPDQWEDFNPRIHDGIVVDDIDYSDQHPNIQKALTEWTNDRYIKVRYVNGYIPAGTKKIFVSNYESIPFGFDPAVQDRLYKVFLSPDLESNRPKLKHPKWGLIDPYTQWQSKRQAFRDSCL